MPESQNDSDTPPHSNSQWYTTYDMFEQKTCVKNKIIKNGESNHPNIARMKNEVLHQPIWFNTQAYDGDKGFLVQPVPWKMRLRMLVGILIEILNGKEIVVK